MCSTNKPNISQLVQPSIRTASIVGTDGMNNNKSMALEFFKLSQGRRTCEGAVLNGARHYYFPFAQLEQIKSLLNDGKTIKVAGEIQADNKIISVDWNAT